MPAFFGFGDGVELKSKLSISLQEILNFPYLLWNKGLAALAVKGLLSLEEAGSPLIVDGKLPGIYLLLIHPNHQVCVDLLYVCVFARISLCLSLSLHTSWLF